MSSFLRLNRPALLGLAAALDAGRVTTAAGAASLRKLVPHELVSSVRDELEDMAAKGMEGGHIAHALRLMAAERASAQAVADRVELVWSGTEVALGESRSTAVVVKELFSEARRSVLIASFAVDVDEKAEPIFGALAARLDDEPGLAVRFFVNVHRPHKSRIPAAILLREFADRFRQKVWPGERLPEVFFDPRSLAIDGKKRASLHAKCVIIDRSRALITSANFTEAAHARNIEAGLVIDDAVVARGLETKLNALVDHGELKRVPGL